MEYIIIIISAIFVNNIVLAKFLGICPFVGVSAKTDTAIGMSGAVMFVMTIATIITWLIKTYILKVYELQFLEIISFILVISSLVQLVEIILKKVSPPLFQALGIYLPLITTNCAILGVAIEASGANEFGLLQSTVFAIANAIGFGLVMILFASLREHLDLVNVPKGMRGVPASFIVAGILALAFMGFSGLV
ncbi:MAG: RnfABCDGE type electron transport complex subunit A [Bacteroidales bacterium]|nr:RnfABCDGE type electron transport complex subunit A [Bacteroidales bacterium]